MFEKLKEKLGLKKKTSIEESSFEDSLTTGLGKPIGDLDEFTDDLKISLLEADVSLSTAEKLSDDLKGKLKGKRIKFGEDRDKVLKEAVKSTLTDMLKIKIPNLYSMASSKSPFIILLVGMNGTGKTTTAAKLAYEFKKRDHYVVIAAADTFRAGAIDQIFIHGEKLGVKVVKHQAGSDPASVAFDAVSHASKYPRSVVIIDTAGRMQTNKNLLEEMKKIKRVSKPDFTILTVDALSGNDALNQAKMFDEAVGIDAIVVTKIDADTKGGSILSLIYELKKPVIFVGNGQTYEDLMEFDPNWYIKNIID
jgi:fused signal recognition particle receptor